MFETEFFMCPIVQLNKNLFRSNRSFLFCIYWILSILSIDSERSGSTLSWSWMARRDQTDACRLFIWPLLKDICALNVNTPIKNDKTFALFFITYNSLPVIFRKFTKCHGKMFTYSVKVFPWKRQNQDLFFSNPDNL